MNDSVDEITKAILVALQVGAPNSQLLQHISKLEISPEMAQDDVCTYICGYKVSIDFYEHV